LRGLSLSGVNAGSPDNPGMQWATRFTTKRLAVLTALALVAADVARADSGDAGPTPGELEIGSAPASDDRTPWIPGATPGDLERGRLRLPAAAEVRLPAAAAGEWGEKTARRLAVFDFEETNDVGVKLGRGVPLPPGWYAVGRPPQSSDANFGRLALHADLTGRTGFPPYNPVRYSDLGAGRLSKRSQPDANDPAGYALHLGLQGGSSAAFVQVGRLPVVPGTRYRVTAAVRTAGLTHAGARVVAYFVDAQGNRLAESVRQTPRLRTGGAWREVSLVLNGEAPRAAYLGLQVELVQPVADGLDPLGEHQVVRTDVSGDAWFDDLVVEQLPQVRVVSDSAVGVVRSDDPPGWSVSVRDLRGERLVARLSLYDARARRVAFDERPLDWGAAAEWRWVPPLTAHGYYRAVLRVVDASSPASPGPAVAQDSHTVLWLPPAEPLAGGAGGDDRAEDDLSRFALLAEGATPAVLNHLPDLLSRLGLRTAVVSALARDTAGVAVHERVAAVQRYLDRAESAGLRTELSLHPLPDELHAGNGPGATAAAVLGGPVDRWFGYVQPVVAQDGVRVAAWHPAGAATGHAVEPTPATAAVLAELTQRLRHWTPVLRLVLPGSLTGPRPAPGDGPAAERMAVWPAGLTPAAVAELVSADPAGVDVASERGARRRWMLRLPPAELLGQTERVAEATLRVVAAWEQGATAVALDHPWTTGPDGDASRLTPDPVAAAVAQTARRLAGYRGAGRLPLSGGLRAVIFRPVNPENAAGLKRRGATPLSGSPSAGETGVLVAWNEQAAPERSFLEVAWGPGVRALDVWGNDAAVSDATDAKPGEAQALFPDPPAAADPADPAEMRRVRVPLGDTPVFITGVDARMMSFRAGFGIDEPLLPARQTPHARTLTLSNPWPVTISGSLTVTGPAGWEAAPRQMNFTISAGETASFPVTLRFPVNALAGPDLLRVRARFTARGRHDVALSVPVELGLPGLGFEPQLMVERSKSENGGLQAVVSCVVTNRGDAPASLSVFASLPGHPRQERLIPRLGPGEAVRRRFIFQHAAAALRNHGVSVGLRETGGAGVLNMRVGTSISDF